MVPQRLYYKQYKERSMLTKEKLEQVKELANIYDTLCRGIVFTAETGTIKELGIARENLIHRINVIIANKDNA